MEDDVAAGPPSEVFRPYETPLPEPVESPGTDPVLPSNDWPLSTTAAEGPGGGSTRRGWIGVVLLAVSVGAASALGAGVGLATMIRAHNTTTITFSPSTSVFRRMNDVNAVLARVLPSVVAIQAFGPGCASGPLGGGAQSEEGSGMILTRGGEILTNDHVIANATEIRVTLDGQKTAYPATLLGTDPGLDVALVQVHGPTALQAVSFAAPSAIEVGEDVLAIGNALALSKSTPSVTEGIISAEGRSITAGANDCAGTESLSGLLQTQAAINAGNSGGPLVNSVGQVIGMNTAAATSTAGNAPTQNIGFAIPISRLPRADPRVAHRGDCRDTQGLLGCRSGLGDAGGALQLGAYGDKRRTGRERVPRCPGHAGGYWCW